MPGTYGTPLFWRGPYAMVVQSSVLQTNASDESLNKWIYSLRPCDWGTNYLEPTQTTESMLWTDCLNVWELNNDETVAMGIAVSNLPGTYELKPCPNGTVVMAYCMPGPEDDNDIEALRVFTWPNQFDGACS
jgi:hypothetical protein